MVHRATALSWSDSQREYGYMVLVPIGTAFVPMQHIVQVQWPILRICCLI